MKRLLLVIVFCLCLCGCGNKEKHYECQISSNNDGYKSNHVRTFDCNGDTVLNDKSSTTLIFDKEDLATRMYQVFALQYDDITLNGKVLKFGLSESQEFIDKIGNCSQYLEYWKDHNWECHEVSTNQ